MESSFVLYGVKSGYSSPAKLRKSKSRKMQRASASVNRAIADWTYWAEMDSSERQADQKASAVILVRQSEPEHHRLAARMTARNNSTAPIDPTQPSLVLCTASPNGPNPSLASATAQLLAVGHLEGVSTL